MVLARSLVCLSVLLAVVGAVPSSRNAVNVFKRSPLLEDRQTCPPGDIPACPVGIPCVPPGAVCCDDGITYVMPPDTCPEGTKPVATASNQGQEPTPTPTPTPEPTPSTSEAAPPTTAEPTTSELPSSTAEPTTTSTLVLPTTNSTIPSTGAPVPSYTQVPVGAGTSLQAGSAWTMGVYAIIAVAPAFLVNWL